jgi:hypothetical protein
MSVHRVSATPLGIARLVWTIRDYLRTRLPITDTYGFFITRSRRNYKDGSFSHHQHISCKLARFPAHPNPTPCTISQTLFDASRYLIWLAFHRNGDVVPRWQARPAYYQRHRLPPRKTQRRSPAPTSGFKVGLLGQGGNPCALEKKKKRGCQLPEKP